MEPRLSTLTASIEHDSRARDFSRYLRAMAHDPGELRTVTSGPLAVFAKAAISAAGTGDSAALQSAARPFLQVVERSTILARLGALTAPPYVTLPTLTSTITADWVGEGRPIPVARVAFTSQLSGLHKFAIILPLTNELVRSTDDRGLSIIERLAGRALRTSEDVLLLSTDAAVADEQPAGLLAGLSPVGGGSPSSLASSLVALWAAVSDGDADRPTYIASKAGGAYLAGLHEEQAPTFPAVGPLGGTLAGVPLLTSAAAGNRLILIDAAQLVTTDDGLLVERAGSASLLMDSAPGAGPQAMTSLWQTNAVALKFTRYLDWALTSATAVAYLELPFAP